MRALLHDPLLYARTVAIAGIIVFVATGGGVIVPMVPFTVAWVVASIVLVTVATRRKGASLSLTEVPVPVVIADLLAATSWMVATALNPRTVSFVLVIVVGCVAMYRLGRSGVLLTVVAYLGGRTVQETLRVVAGAPTPVSTIIGDSIVVTVAVVILAATVDIHLREQGRARRALERARSLERVALDIGVHADPDAVLRSLPRTVRALITVDHAALIVRRGSQFEIVAGDGTAAAVVGVRASAEAGLVGDVIRQRATVAIEDYAAHPSGVAQVRALGLRAALGVPIFVHGEIAAVLMVGRVVPVQFDTADVDAVEGFASHAAIAIANARALDQARRLEAVARLVATEGSADEVVTRIAEEAAAAFSAEFVLIAEIDERPRSRIIAAIGTAAPLAGRTDEELGPLMREVVAGRRLVALGDYLVERGGWATDGEGTVDLHATMAAPALIGGDVAAIFVIGTTDPHRSFDVIDRQGLLAFTESTAVALRAAAARHDRDQRIDRLAALNVLAGELAQVREPLRIARLAWEACGTLVARDAFYIARYEPERKLFHFLFQEDQGIVEESDFSEAWAGEMVVPLGTGPTSQVILTGEIYLTRPEDPVQHRDRRYGDHARRHLSAVHVPLKIGGRIVGVLSAQAYRAGAYDAEDVAILGSLANLVASAFANAEHLARGRELYLASVKALAAAVDARDPYTRSHSARVAALSRIIAEEMALSPDEIRRVQLGALLHDIGKIGIPDAILNKPSALTEEEWVIMRTHSVLGASILSAVEPLRDLVPIVRCHHERHDGTGYPDRLRGAEIPLASTIVAAADAYEVIVSKRSYKAAQPVEFAIAELVSCRGTQFHPDVVDAFLRVIERDRTHGTMQLRRVGSIEHEDIEDVPGPGEVLERYVARSQTHTRQLAIVQRLATEISAVLDIDDLAVRLLRIVCDAMGYENGFLATLDELEGAIVVRAAVGPSLDYVGHRLKKGQGVSWWVLEHGLLQNVPDVHADTRYFGPPDIRSSLIVPLRIGEERVGVLGIESTSGAAFTSEDEELLTAVSHQVAAAIRVARLHDAAKTAASTDLLTSLPNRRAFFEHLELSLRQAAEGMPLAVAIVDVNLLKDVNDRYGHNVGDEALVRIGGLLTAGVRGGDFVARIGGDEFAVLFPGAPVLAAERIMRRLAESIAEAKRSDGLPLPTVAWGIAIAPEGPTTVDAVIDGADRAMYRQKQRGRAQPA